MSKTVPTFLKIAAACAVVGPIILLLSDVMHITMGMAFEWSIGLWAAFMLIVPAVIGFTFYLAEHGSRLAYFGGALAFFGAMAGASMQVLFRTHAVLEEQGLATVVEQLRGTIKLVATTQMIGIAWPIGLLLLAISTLTVDRGKWLISLLLTIGAVAFPIGRIAGSEAAVILSGVLFIAAFSLISHSLMNYSSRLE